MVRPPGPPFPSIGFYTPMSIGLLTSGEALGHISSGGIVNGQVFVALAQLS
jgi:hypothetical protein